MTVVATNWSSQRTTEDVRADFSRLVLEWRKDRGPSSSMTKIAMHPAYQRIIGMGPVVIPLIVAELRREPDFWHWALHSITGEQPVSKEHAGDLLAITGDWLKWANSKGL